MPLPVCGRGTLFLSRPSMHPITLVNTISLKVFDKICAKLRQRCIVGHGWTLQIWRSKGQGHGHRHRGAQSTLGCTTFLPLPQKCVWKINKMREFYVILAWKIIKIPTFLWYLSEKLTKFPNFIWFCRKNARILHNNFPKNISSRFFFGGGGARALPTRLLGNAYGHGWIKLVGSST